VVYRCRTHACETLETPGAWVAATRDIRPATLDSELWLEEGDVMLLYTDGVIEATNVEGEPFGLARLCRELERVGTESVEAIRDHRREQVLRWLGQQRDDIALLVARQGAPRSGSKGGGSS